MKREGGAFSSGNSILMHREGQKRDKNKKEKSSGGPQNRWNGSGRCLSHHMTNSRHARPTHRALRHVGPQGATPRTRPPAPPPHGRRPQAGWAAHCTTPRPRTLVPARYIKSTSLSNPEGPRRGCAAHRGLISLRKSAQGPTVFTRPRARG